MTRLHDTSALHGLRRTVSVLAITLVVLAAGLTPGKATPASCDELIREMFAHADQAGGFWYGVGARTSSCPSEQEIFFGTSIGEFQLAGS